MAVKPERQSGLDLTPGTTLGKFEIIRKLAVGGMAEIYLARVHGTAGFEKLVVLKRILPHIAQDPAFVQMFLDEARLAATLQHPNIADVYEVGELGGDVFFTMEYVHGQDVRGIRWAARKRDEPIPLAIALAIVHGTASALDYAHDKRGSDGHLLGLVHRDVSSSNIMISYDGAIKLLDFGIARLTNRQAKTQTGTLKGKIPYMSPEQCRGNPLDRRSDLFSLGTVMFEVTVGRRPFRGQSDFDTMEQIVHHGAPRPSSVVNGYPPELEAIVMKLLARDPDDRYQSAEELLHALEPMLAQHRLWASSKVMGKYMRLVFADRIAAWEQAQQQGLSFVQHVANADQDVSEVLTPASAFPGIRMSQGIPAVLRPSGEISVPVRASSELLALRQQTGGDEGVAGPNEATIALKMTPATPFPAVGNDSSVATKYPTLRSNRRLGFVIGGLVAGVLGIVAVILIGHGGKNEASAADPDPAATDTKTVETKATETKATEAPSPDKPEVRPPAEQPGHQVADENEAKTDEKSDDKSDAKTNSNGDKQDETKPGATPVHRVRTIRRKIVPKQPPKPPDKPEKKKKKKEWNPDSPFLPGQSP